MDMIKVGPIGGSGGSIWEEECDGLAGIFVLYDQDTVYSLQFLNYVDGKLDMSTKHGTRKCEIYRAVILDYPSEFLTSISGSFERVTKKLRVLRSIRFDTNKGSYGPFGTPASDVEFKFMIGNHQLFGGFHGSKNSDGIESIGFYVKDIPYSVIKLKDSPGKVKKVKNEKY
ncbi:inactive protein RESTRICTED TEV MOVEMENT 1-like [Capsicum galapagoense]